MKMMKLFFNCGCGIFLIMTSNLLQADEEFFNGKDFKGWSANDMSYWSVQDGAIVGTKGDQRIEGNQFLWYERKVRDFRLTLSVRQTPFAANGGIQFRSERQPNGSAIGYQADITVAVHDPIGELDGQISLQIHGGMPQKIIYRDLGLVENPKIQLQGMKELELEKLLSFAPKGYSKPNEK